MISEIGGDNLNTLQFAQLIDGSSAQELFGKLQAIRQINSVVWIWAAGSSHYAIVNLPRKFNGDLNEAINTKRKNKKDIQNGSN